MTWSPRGRFRAPATQEDQTAASFSSSTPTGVQPANAPSREENSATAGLSLLESLTDRIRNLADEIHQDLQEADRTGG